MARILSREMLDAEPVRRADAHALHHAVGHDGERLAVLDREQQHEPDIALVRRGRHFHAPRIAAGSRAR